MDTKNTWFLVANSARARIFSLCKARLIQAAGQGQNSEKLTLETECEHPESRQKGKELVSDKLPIHLHGTVGEPSQLHQTEADHFARELAKKMEEARKHNQYQQLIIAAPSHFVGLLKKHFTAEMMKKLDLVIEKDYTSHNEKQLVSDLEEQL